MKFERFRFTLNALLLVAKDYLTTASSTKKCDMSLCPRGLARRLCIAWLALIVIAAGMVTAAPASAIVPVVTATSWEINGPGKVLDNNLNTRWSNFGEGSWLRLDYGAVVPMTAAEVAFFVADQRVSTFSIEVSSDGSTWTRVLDHVASSTVTVEKQSFAFPATQNARYIRYVGHGTDVGLPSQDAWNAVTEFGAASSGALSQPAASASDWERNRPENVADGSLFSRWADQGSGSQLLLDYGTAIQMTAVEIAFYLGGEQVYTFHVDVSENGSSWTRVLTNAQSAGLTGATKETFTFNAQTARYVRFLGQGSSVNNWNSITEMSVASPDITGPGSGTVTAPTTGAAPKNVPGRVEAEAYTRQSGVIVQGTGDADGVDHLGYIQNGDYVEYQVIVPVRGRYTLKFRVAASGSGGNIGISASGSNIGSINVASTGGWNTWKTVTTEVDLAAGQQALRLAFTGVGGYLFNLNWVDVTTAGVTIPAKVEAEAFQRQIGTQIESNPSASGGAAVGYIQTTDSLEYDLYVPSTGSYTLDFRVASGNNGGSINVVGPLGTLGSVDVANTGGWNNWQDVSMTVSLNQGQQTLITTFLGSGYILNLDSIDFTSDAGVPSGSTPSVPTSRISLPKIFEAEAYARQSGVQQETSPTSRGGAHIGYIQSGDYLEFDVDIARNSTYEVKAHASSNTSGGEIRILENGVYLDSVNIPHTGGWSTFATYAATNLSLEAGTKTIRVEFVGGGDYLFNVDWFSFYEVAPEDPTTAPDPSLITCTSDAQCATLTSITGAMCQNPNTVNSACICSGEICSTPAPATNALLTGTRGNIIDILGYGDNFDSSNVVSFHADSFSTTGHIRVNGVSVAPFENGFVDGNTTEANNHALIATAFTNGLKNSGLGVNNGAVMLRFAELNTGGMWPYATGDFTGNFFAAPPSTPPNKNFMRVPVAPTSSSNMVWDVIGVLVGSVLRPSQPGETFHGQVADSMVLAAIWEGLDAETAGTNPVVRSASTAWNTARALDAAQSVTAYSDGNANRQFGELGAIWMTVAAGNLPEQEKNFLREAYEGSFGYFDTHFATLINTPPVGPSPPPPNVAPNYMMTASSWQANPDALGTGRPEDAADGSLNTLWGMPGDGAWLQLDIGGLVEVTSVDIAFFAGNTRRSEFSIDVSENGTDWRPVLTRRFSAGVSAEKQRWGFAGRKARYVRLIGYGNSVDEWNMVTEISVSTAVLDSTTTFAAGPVISENITPRGQSVIQSMARRYGDPAMNKFNNAVRNFGLYIQSKEPQFVQRIEALAQPLAPVLWDMANAPIDAVVNFPAVSSVSQTIDPLARSYGSRAGFDNFVSLNVDVYASADTMLRDLLPARLTQLRDVAGLGERAFTIGPHFDVRAYLPILNLKEETINSIITGTTRETAGVNLSQGTFLIGVRVSKNAGVRWFGSSLTGFGGVDIILFFDKGKLREIRVAPTLEGVGVLSFGTYPAIIGNNTTGLIRARLNDAVGLLDNGIKTVGVGSLGLVQFTWLIPEGQLIRIYPDLFGIQAVVASGLAVGFPSALISPSAPNLDLDTVVVAGAQGAIAITDRGAAKIASWDYQTGQVGISPATTAAATPEIPGLIQAEAYDLESGTQKEETADVGLGEHVGYIQQGDFLEFNVNVATAGQYEMQFRVASASVGGTIDIKADGANLGYVNVTNTGGWNAPTSWTTVTATVNLTAGPQALRLDFSGANTYLFNLNWINVVAPASP